jgi:hypothetical protein
MMFFRRNVHLDDTTLLLAAEGELSPRAAASVAKHLRCCDGCRTRQRWLMSAEADIAVVAAPPGHDALRERLLTQLNAAPEPQRVPLLHPRRYLQVAAVVALLAVAFVFREAYSPLQDRLAAYEETGPEPNHVLTPGATRPVDMVELCTSYDPDLDPAVSLDKQRAIFQAYGMDEKAARAYQLDYLINPQLGGNDDPANLWPEPYHATVWNATAKDALEARLHGMVCSGQLDLEQAQHDLATDWIAAYKKYFHTARPVRTMATIEEPSRQR